METTDLYGGRIKLCFDPGKHLYTVDGRPVDGVTSALGAIAKPALVPWAVKMAVEHFERSVKPGVALDEIEIARICADAKAAHRRSSGDAAAIGTLVHQFAEDVLDDGIATMPVNPQAEASCRAFLEWTRQHNVKPSHVERRIYSHAYNYAGTCDLVAEIDGRLTVADFKTSSGLYDEMRFQVSAYKAAMVEEGIVPEDAARAIIRFSKVDGSFEFHRLPDADDEPDFEAFLAALAIYRRQRALNPPRGRKAA